MINQEKVRKKITVLKKGINMMVTKKDIQYLSWIEKLNKKVVLVIADFKCQNPKCNSEDNLQIHHLITRVCKKYMDTWRYLSQRHYWANQICLCERCHKQIHLDNGKDTGEVHYSISKEKIIKIKNYFSK